MDFIEGLPNSEGKVSVLVVVDRLTKYSHFIALQHLYTTTSVAKIFFDNIYKLHGLPEILKVLQLLKHNLHQAQQRMKTYANRKRIEKEFEVGDEIFLKLQPYRQTSFSLRRQLKLSTKYFGPYKAFEKIGKVSYKLELPPGSRIYPVFRVSLLKKKLGSKYFPSANLPKCEDEIFKVYPVAILARRLIPRNNVGIPQILIQWSYASLDQATWEDYHSIAARFPGTHLDRTIEGTTEFGGGLNIQAQNGVVLGALGHNRTEEKIGDFTTAKPSQIGWTECYVDG
ncbi:UNVERIFIED_CONTAM: hypothetical protein Sradi_1317800 [Sesamum radiatum]|uniref:Tf2-1-like SH3-like domain-containing protein n=1 Tax=Sesamum radiatum TaxID=300843 RepID=A0AAW2UR79_SESRA